MTDPSYLFVFTAGLLSFLSPCMLPLIPAYLSYITGLSLDEVKAGPVSGARWGTVIRPSLLFILGFSSVFIALGASASGIGRLLMTYKDLVGRAGGLLIIVFGLSVLGVLNLQALAKEVRWQPATRPTGWAGPIAVGAGFAAGWVPCIGPILGSVLMYAGTTTSLAKGVMLLVVYSLGHALPLLFVAFAAHSVLPWLARMQGTLVTCYKASGVVMVLVGAVLLTNTFPLVVAFLSRHGIGWYVGQ